MWRFQVSELSKHYRVICYDNRGAGRTSAPDTPYSMAGMAEDLAALMDQLRIDSAHLVGWSMGGVIAQAFAVARPERVRKLVLISTFVRSDGLLRVGQRNWMNIRRSNMPFEHVVRCVSQGLYTAALYDDEPRYEKIVHLMATNPYAQTQHGFLRQAEALLAHDAGDAAKDIQAPTLVLVGKHDPRTPPYLSEKIAKLIPNATLKVLDGAHAGVVEFASLYNAAIHDFLQ
ncbi:MAG: alpha/beta fold hydrolase [Burkholderiales bacterium]|nr:alpha/beta fold hydrolase [Burkholderiales bacterium]